MTGKSFIQTIFVAYIYREAGERRKTEVEKERKKKLFGNSIPENERKRQEKKRREGKEKESKKRERERGEDKCLSVVQPKTMLTVSSQDRDGMFDCMRK